MRASYLEIYNEEVRDLLSKEHQKKMELKESPDRGVYVKDLSQFVCKNFDEIYKVLKVRAGRCCHGSLLCWHAALHADREGACCTMHARNSACH